MSYKREHIYFNHSIKINSENYFKVGQRFNLKLSIKQSIFSLLWIDFINMNQWENNTAAGIQYMGTLEARKLSQRHN